MTGERDRPPVRYASDIVVIDLEASSAEPEPNEIATSNIIEIGAVRLSGKDLAVIGTFSELVCPREYPITPRIERLTGITPAMVAGKDDFGETAQRFLSWYGPRNRAILAAFGAYYDIPLLRKEFRTFGLDFGASFVGGALDIRSLALAWLASRGHSTTGLTLERIAAKMGIETDSLAAHRALDDAKAAAAVLRFYHLGEGRL